VLLWLLMPPSAQRAVLSKVVLYVDRGVIVLNKPPGLVCQTSQAEVSGKVKQDGSR